MGLAAFFSATKSLCECQELVGPQRLEYYLLPQLLRAALLRTREQRK